MPPAIRRPFGAPGSIATLFGTNLAAATATASGVPLPRQLGGTRVTWNGVAAPLFYVSPTQINFQVPNPYDTIPGVLVTAGVVVSTAAGNSVPYKSGNGWYAAGLFSMDGSGCGQGAVLNVAANGSVSLNSAAPAPVANQVCRRDPSIAAIGEPELAATGTTC